MKYLFFGTPEFAAIVLEKLINSGFPPTGIVCNPDRPVGRKKIITPPPTKIIGEKNGIPALQPEKLSDLKIGKIDFAIVVAYSKIIPKDILERFELGVLGVHPSLLPKYRGATPIQSVILAGENETGVSLYLMDERVDHGPILTQRELESPISNLQYPILQRKLAELAAVLLIELLPKFMKEKIKPEAQDETKATYTKKFTTDDARVDLIKDDPILVERKIRALNPEPGTWTIQNGKRIKLLEAEVKDGKLKLKMIQVEGEKPKRIN
ncbi:MAG: methionyl-tRNA formyltransferase [Patescibacteria group bacterium]